MTATVIPGKRYRAPERSVALRSKAASIYTSHDLRGTDFTGTVLYSTPEGKLILGVGYEQGVRVNYLVPKGSTLQPTSCGAECGPGGRELSAAGKTVSSLSAHALTSADGHPLASAVGHELALAPGLERPAVGKTPGSATHGLVRVGSITIDLVDSSTATPAYTMSFEWGPYPGDDGWGDIDPVEVYACGCRKCHGQKDDNGYCSECGFQCPPKEIFPPDPDPDPFTPGGGYGGGGGVTPPPTGTPVMARPNIPTKMRIQKPNRCVSSSMAFVNKVFGGERTDRDFSRLYKGTFGERIGKNGVLDLLVTPFVNQNFFTTPFINYRSAIDRGYVVMVAVQAPVSPLEQVLIDHGVPYEPSAHSVVVIGYESGTDHLIVMDPLTGGKDTIAESEVLDLYRIVIRGNK
jgi:hypothetical protein